MKKVIKTYEYEKVEKDSHEIFIPDEPFYCFQTGVRRSIRIVPVFANVNDVYALKITAVYLSMECKIEKITLHVNRIEDLVNRNEKSLEAEYAQMLFDEDYCERDAEQFLYDLMSAISEINKQY